MRAQIEVLSEVFEEWLRSHDLDYDYWIYTHEEWARRGEEVLSGAELVIAFENQLVPILNYTGPWQVEEELQDLAGGFGYYFEMGHHWNIGFYPLERWPALPPEKDTYRDLLNDSRWANKRQRILTRSSGKCEDCGSESNRFQIHHCYYRMGRYPWQYPDISLLALCPECHKSRQKLELRWRAFMPKLTSAELRSLRDTLDKCLYWFDRGALFNFLSSLPHEVQNSIDFALLISTRGHPEERKQSNTTPARMPPAHNSGNSGAGNVKA